MPKRKNGAELGQTCLCCELGPDGYEDHIKNLITEYGCAVESKQVSVAGTSYLVTCTIGLAPKLPELFLFTVPTEPAHKMLMHAVELLKSGELIADVPNHELQHFRPCLNI